MFKLGLTGGIGSGKTQVANQLAKLGACVIDTDEIAHALTAPQGQAIEPIRKAFGDLAIKSDGSLDRDHMRALVFDEPQARARLEGILHPMITQEVERATANAQGCYAVFVVPLLVESGRWRDRVDRICVVDCEPQTQVQRVQQRSRLSKHRIEQIMQAQATRQERLAVADDVIDNGAHTSCEALQTQVLGLHQQWCNLSR